MLLPTYHINCLVQCLEDMELVEDNASLGKVRQSTRNERSGHIHTNGLNVLHFALLLYQCLTESLESTCTFAFGDKDGFAGIQINELRYVVMSLPLGGFVHTDVLHL